MRGVVRKGEYFSTSPIGTSLEWRYNGSDKLNHSFFFFFILKTSKNFSGVTKSNFPNFFFLRRMI